MVSAYGQKTSFEHLGYHKIQNGGAQETNGKTKWCTFFDSPYFCGSGGGLAVLHRSNLKVELLNSLTFKSFEHMVLLLFLI